MTMAYEVSRINHIAELCRKNKMSRKDFIYDVGGKMRISRPTLEKAYDGSTDLDLAVVEKIALYFNVSPQDVLETKW